MTTTRHAGCGARRALVAVGLALLLCASPPASGQGRPSTTRMSCREAFDLVRRAGEIELGTGGTSYGRYVRDRSFCDLSEIAELRFAPTRDNPQCPIGYRCREPDFEDWDW